LEMFHVAVQQVSLLVQVDRRLEQRQGQWTGNQHLLEIHHHSLFQVFVEMSFEDPKKVNYIIYLVLNKL
jgi:hypothetical protein